MSETTIANWNNYPAMAAEVISPATEAECINALKKYPTLIPRGMGRSYGDASLAPVVLDCTHMNRILEVNINESCITVEAGISIDAILNAIVPSGFFLPVVPGTKFISVGGAIAADIHGKNHHKDGTFCRHVKWIDLIDENLKVVRCSATENVDLFQQTCGGMGITGVVVRACIQLIPIETSYIHCTTLPFTDLQQLLNAFETYQSSTYNVAWLDTLSFDGQNIHSILMLGEHAAKINLKNTSAEKLLLLHSSPNLNIPSFFPSFLMNVTTINIFNKLFYLAKKITAGAGVMHYDSYFFPLDKIKNWNRMYGKKGFLQYQCLVPFTSKGKEALKQILEACRIHQKASFLTVLKAFGESNPQSYMSFPSPGYTLTMDLKMSDDLLEFLSVLDKIVENCGGKLYLAKDARMSKDFFDKSYSRKVISSRFISSLSKRLGLYTNNKNE